MSSDASYTVLGPPASPSPPASGEGAPATRLSFVFGMIEIMPPWLRRRVGGAVVEGLGVPIETEVDRSVESLRLRFPNGDVEEALGYLGRERRILRGPGELGDTFALRLRGWWDAHRTRGSAPALLRQLYEYFLATNNVPITYVSNLGTSNAQIDPAGVIAYGGFAPATWSGDGEVPPQWARFFLFFEFAGTTYSTPLVDEFSSPILTEDGEAILVDVDLYSLTSSEIDELCAVPREWSAAHIDRIYLRLVPLNGIAWGFPSTLQWGDVGRTWGGDLVVEITC